MTAESQSSFVAGTKRVLVAAMKYLGFYFLGIAACILFTPVELVLAGKPLWPLYPVLSAIFFILFYLDSPPPYVFGRTFVYWLISSLGVILVLLGAGSYLNVLRRLRAFRPFLIGFPVGFVGTLSVYYHAAASI